MSADQEFVFVASVGSFFSDFRQLKLFAVLLKYANAAGIDKANGIAFANPGGVIFAPCRCLIVTSECDNRKLKALR